MRRRSRTVCRPVAILFGALLAADPAGAVTMIDACGTSLTGEGILTADLACPDTRGVMIQEYGSLDLNGHTISSGEGVACFTDLPCVISSSGAPGHILASGIGFYGISQFNGGGLVVQNIVVDGFYNGIQHVAGRGRVTIEDSSVIHCTNQGISATSVSLAIKRSVISDNPGDGAGSEKLRIEDSEVARNGGTGLASNQLSMTNTDVVENGESGLFLAWGPHKIASSEVSRNDRDGAEAGGSIRGIKVTDSMFDDNGRFGVGAFLRIHATRTSFNGNGEAGVMQDYEGEARASLRLRESVATGNGHYGFAQTVGPFSGLLLKASSATGNGTAVACGVSVACSDLDSPIEPRLDETSACDHSHVYGSGLPGTTWGVCSAD